MRGGDTVDDDPGEPIAAPSPAAPPIVEEPSDELDLLPEPDDLFEEAEDLEVDPEDEAADLVTEAREEETDPNAATQPDQEPLVVTSPPESAVEADLEATEFTATAADHLAEIQPPASGDGIPVDEMDRSPDDEVEIQTGAESLFDAAGTDLSQYDDEPER